MKKEYSDMTDDELAIARAEQDGIIAQARAEKKKIQDEVDARLQGKPKLAGRKLSPKSIKNSEVTDEHKI